MKIFLKTFVIFTSVLSIVCSSSVFAQTIAEKKAGFSPENQDMTQEMQKYLIEVNRDLRQSQEELRELYGQVGILFQENACAESYRSLLEETNKIRQRVIDLQTSWRDMSVKAGSHEAYGLWHQPETTIGQLIMDYGSHDYVYLLPPEVANLKLSVDSNLLIPRASWEEMLDLILTQNGIGFNQLNPFLRQLFFLKDNRSGLKLITNRRQDLEAFPPESRVCFMLVPEPAEVRRTWLFLEKFVNPNSTVLQQIGRDILIIGQIPEVQDLLKLYDFISANKGEKEYKIFPVSRVDTEEMARILMAIFDQQNPHAIEMPRPPFPPGKGPGPNPNQRFGSNGPSPTMPFPPPPGAQQTHADFNGLKIIPLIHVARALFLVGTKEELRKAEQIIQQVESQVGEARERIIYWYTAKHTNPEELADILFRIYTLMIRKHVAFPDERHRGEEGPIQLTPIPTAEQVADQIVSRERDLLPSELYQTSYYQQGNYVVNPAPVEPRRQKAPVVTQNRDNFIVDPKSGSIAMVIEADLLPKIKDLIKKLDVAQRMVQIEVLLVERRVNKQNNFGLNLLRFGDCAENIKETCWNWFDTSGPSSGILDFILKRKKSCSLPAYNVIYRFLMTQDDIQINASPSVVAINQTPATIAIVEEISINTGIYNVETAKGNTLERAFTRAQYGITIDILPTIFISEGEDGEDDPEDPNSVMLETDITFDTIQPGIEPERPDVTRRHITNEVRIPDGQTVILGGLRRRTTDDFKESIPFLGELPALGKFFSMRELSDHEVEMFIFMTPTIISDPLEDFERIKCEEMKRRPGDIPEFLCSLIYARDREKDRVLHNSMEILFGQDPGRCYTPSYWRPSTCNSGYNTPSTPWFDDSGISCDEYDGQ